MSTTFTDFLRQKAAKYEAESDDNQAAFPRGSNAFKAIRTDPRRLNESVPEGVLKIEQSDWPATARNDRHPAPASNSAHSGKEVYLVPEARKTIGSASSPQKSAPDRAIGRVDITDEIRDASVSPFARWGKDAWYINDPVSGEQKPLDQQTFEAALMSYFQ